MDGSTHWWDDPSNHGVIGLGPGPWEDTTSMFAWPMAGHDYPLTGFDWDATAPIPFSGHTAAEWLELADVMLARWAAFRAHIIALRDGQVP